MNCEVSDFGPWTECSKSCGGGTRTKTRKVTQEKAGTGSECPTNLHEDGTCNNDVCPGNLSYNREMKKFVCVVCQVFKRPSGVGAVLQTPL